MKPRLIAMTGQRKDAAIALTGQIVTIGRESSQTIRLPDLSVSRSHCAIEPAGARYRLRDLDSRNGTFVNGVPVGEHVLRHGDQIEIGRSLFLFVDDETSAESSSGSHGSVSLVTRTVGPTRADTEVSRSSLTGRDLQTLLRISTAIYSLQALYAARESTAREALERQLLALIFESIPAQRGAVVLASDLPCEPDQIGREIVERVISEGAPILDNDVKDSEVRCLMAAPLTVSDKVLGVIYLDSTLAGSRFADDHLQLLCATASIAVMALENARYVEWLRGENQRLRDEIELDHNMVGESPAIRQVLQFISRVAPTESTVLITGESGTGKELVARAIHQNSPRADKPFVAVNCAALTETLLESEFFGHERGAFTGAVAQKKGKLEVAEGGTVFLDEIGEMAPGLQAKLLRVIQERSFERVGGTRSLPVNVRIVAATNRDLAAAIKEGRFRLDLYYRLNVVSIETPPLRERVQDIPLLARYFSARISKNLKRPVMSISPEAHACLVRYDWPGNIRELENAIERAVVLGSTDLIRVEDLPDAVADSVLNRSGDAAEPAAGKYQVALHETRKQAILKAMEESRGSVTEAAKLLGVHPNYLHRLIRNLNLRPAIRSSTGKNASSA